MTYITKLYFNGIFFFVEVSCHFFSTLHFYPLVYLLVFSKFSFLISFLFIYFTHLFFVFLFSPPHLFLSLKFSALLSFSSLLVSSLPSPGFIYLLSHSIYFHSFFSLSPVKSLFIATLFQNHLISFFTKTFLLSLDHICSLPLVPFTSFTSFAFKLLSFIYSF